MTKRLCNNATFRDDERRRERDMYTSDGNRLIIVFLFRTRPSLFWGEIQKRSRNLSVAEAIDRAGFPSECISRRGTVLSSWIERTRRGWNGVLACF